MRKEDPSSTIEIMRAVRLRGEVNLKAKHDLESAYTLAKSIEHPWYRCQALAQVAEFSPPSTIHAILEESFNSAMKCHDENRRISVACRPLSVALNHDLIHLASTFLLTCTSQLDHGMDPLSKWCAVTVLHTIKNNASFLDKFYDAFVRATAQGYGWRVERDIDYLLSDPIIQNHRHYKHHLETRKNSLLTWKADRKKCSRNQ
jgi:hypothetical protein